MQPQPEPADFQSKVFSKGARYLAQSNPQPPVANSHWKNRTYWTDALDDLRTSYGGVCAFSAIRIAPVTGAGSVEHFKPKSKYPNQAYDWANFRLVCTRMNGRKQDHEDVADPFTLPADAFELNPITGGIRVHPQCPAAFSALAQSTIDRLGLDDPLCRADRLDHVSKIVNKDWSPEELRKQSPFVFARLQAQGLI